MLSLNIEQHFGCMKHFESRIWYALFFNKGNEILLLSEIVKIPVDRELLFDNKIQIESIPMFGKFVKRTCRRFRQPNLYFFIAEYSKVIKLSDGSELKHEEENIEMLKLGIYDSMKMNETGEINDKKTIIFLQYVRLKRLMWCYYNV